MRWAFQWAAPTADATDVRTLGRTALTAALVTASLAVPHAQAAAVRPADLAQLQRALDAATAQTAALGDALEQQVVRDLGLRGELNRLDEQHEQARRQLDTHIRDVWISRQPDPLASWVDGLADPSLRRLAAQGAAAAVSVDRRLLDAVAARSETTEQARTSTAATREELRVQANAAVAAQERAQALLAQAEAVLAERTAAAARRQADAAERAVLAGAQRRLDESRVRLDAVAGSVTSTLAAAPLTPAQTRRSARAEATEAPVLALVEAAGSGYPQGYAPTTQVLSGLASWYGPGFVGSPTASGTPYDPERMTCAHKTLPLGTVVRVSGNGRAVSCLVNDRGPYVGPRILDMSRAGSRALGFDGVQQVTVEVLARETPPA